jgi:lysophospholipase L1-like esterase
MTTNERWLAQAIINLHTLVLASLNDTDNRRVRDYTCVTELHRLRQALPSLKEIANGAEL